MRKLSFVAFKESVHVPNVKMQTAVNAEPGITDRAGYNLAFDEEFRMVLVESRKPHNPAIDSPVFVPLENVKFFRLEPESKPEPKK